MSWSKVWRASISMQSKKTRTKKEKHKIKIICSCWCDSCEVRLRNLSETLNTHYDFDFMVWFHKVL